MKKTKTKIEWEFHPDDMPEIPIDIFDTTKIKINKGIKKTVKLKRTRDGSTGFRKKLF